MPHNNQKQIMYRSLILIILSFSSQLLNAQTKVIGVVVDAQGKGIPGANVFIKDSYDGASSDSTGKFSFTTTETGEHFLSVSFLGFEKWEQRILLDTAERKVRVKMKEEVNELKAVEYLATQWKVLLIPCSEESCGLRGYIRVSYANATLEVTKQAAARLKEGLKQIRENHKALHLS